jgi:hypothetical protein
MLREDLPVTVRDARSAADPHGRVTDDPEMLLWMSSGEFKIV